MSKNFETFSNFFPVCFSLFKINVSFLYFLENSTVVLVDRQHRRYPIKADFVGISLSTTLKERVEVELSPSDSYAYLV